MAAFIFNFVAKAVVNPNNMKPDVIVEEDGVIIKYYSGEVANNVPMMFQILAACWLTMGYIAILIIKVPKEMIQKNALLKNTENNIIEQNIEGRNVGFLKEIPPNREENENENNLKKVLIESAILEKNIKCDLSDTTIASIDINTIKIGRFLKK